MKEYQLRINATDEGCTVVLAPETDAERRILGGYMRAACGGDLGAPCDPMGCEMVWSGWSDSHSDEDANIPIHGIYSIRHPMPDNLPLNRLLCGDDAWWGIVAIRADGEIVMQQLPYDEYQRLSR